MARKGISISVASETRDFSKGVASGVIEPLEDIAAELDDVANAGRKAGDRLEDSMRDAQRKTEDLKKEHKELHDVIEKGSRTSFKRMADASGDATRVAGDNVTAFKDEARQNFAEVASSFDGTADGIINGMQGLSGGLAMSMGPAGLGVAAMGAGAAAVYAAWKENTEKTKQAVSDMYDDMRESGDDYLSKELIAQRVSDIIDGADDAVMQMKTVNAIVEETGLTQAKVIAAAAGDLESRAQVIEALNDTLTGLQTQMADAPMSDKAGFGGAISAVAALKDKVEALNSKQVKATDQIELYKDAIAALDPTNALSGQSRAYESLKGNIDGATSSLNAMPTSKTITIKADTSGLDAAITNWTASRRPVKIAAEFVTRDGKQVY